MRILRLACLAGVLAATGLLAAQQPPAQPKSKQDIKKEQRLELRKKLLEQQKKAEEAKTAPAKVEEKVPAKPVVTPKPTAAAKEPAALAKLIDQQIDAKLAVEKFTPSPLCSDEEFLRRVYLDLTGIIPTADKAKAFLDSKDPQKRAMLIDELLADPNYGKHLADIWQAKLTVRDSANRFVLREPFVKWLEEEFNKNTPWNEFVTKLVTASGEVGENPAVTYFLMNRSVDKLTDSVSQHFLGLQLQCAQCHNHPFTQWKQTEYWGMAAFFSKVQPQNPKNANKGADNTKIGVSEGVAKSKLKDFFPEAAKDVPPKFFLGAEPKLNAKDPYRPAFAEWLTSASNPYFAKAMVNRTWAQLFGMGFVNPIEDMHEDNIPSHPELLAALSAEFAGSGFDLKHLIRGICLSQTYQRTSKPTAGNDKDEHYFSHMTVKVLTPEQLYDSLSVVSGPTPAERAKKPVDGTKRQGNGPRDQFVQFFLAGAEMANTAEYEAGIPQALRLMNSRFGGGAQVAKRMVPTGAAPAAAIESIYLNTLSRRPTATETERLTAYVTKSANAAEAFGDILWAVLNSSEFAMVR